MPKNWDKKTKKRYVTGAVLLFSALLLVSLALVFGFSHLGTNDYTAVQKLGIAVLCALLPTGSYTGCCLMFIGRDELTKKQCILLVVFCLPLVLYACVYGTVMLLPTVAASLKK